MNENYTLTADSVQDSSSSQPTDVTETTVQPAQHTADRPPINIAHHESESPPRTNWYIISNQGVWHS